MEPVLRFSGAAISHGGLVRADNEDSGYLGPLCMLVADGVGGAAAGEVASATAAYVVSELALGGAPPDPVDRLRGAVRMAQEQVRAGVRKDPARTGMATTLTALVSDGQRFALAHVGDSRGYVLRDDRLTRVTTDHTWVQRLVDEGSLCEDEVAHHPWRHVLTRSVNGSPEEVGDVTPLRLLEGDRVLLSSDGLTDLVPEVRIQRLLVGSSDLAAARSLVDAALAAGGTDNVTVLLATVVAGGALRSDPQLVGAASDPHNVVDLAAVRMPRIA